MAVDNQQQSVPSSSARTEKKLLWTTVGVLFVLAVAAAISYWVKPTGPWSAD